MTEQSKPNSEIPFGQAVNPFLPSWEYIPDAEPYVFDGRVYLFGSHDLFNGYAFCLGNYVSYSAPVTDLSAWRYEGEIYAKTQDPLNPNSEMCLYAPDVTRGPDGRYYLYYALDKVSVISVAVCDTPAGKYEFYGYVSYPDGTRLGERAGDEPQFDPGVLTEGTKTYLYTGFCGIGDKSRSGAWATVLDADMVTIVEEPVLIVPGSEYGADTSFAGHEYFEAASIRKIGHTYYFIYSSKQMTELCYATSSHPTKGFSYGGCIISNCDLNIATYKPAEKRIYPAGNNHGSIIEINGKWYVFYHRMTNGTWFSRQACIEPITLTSDGQIPQVEMTSQGANGKPLIGHGTYPAYITCALFNDSGNCESANSDSTNSPRVTQDGRDGDQEPGYIANITDGAVIGFKFFDFTELSNLTLTTRAYGDGVFEIRTTFNRDAPPIGEIKIENANVWTDFATHVTPITGTYPLYLTYRGAGTPQLASFTLS